MNKFILEITEIEDHYNVKLSNTGFKSSEMVGLIEIIKQDLIAKNNLIGKSDLTIVDMVIEGEA